MAVRVDSTTDRLIRTTDLFDFNAAYTIALWFYQVTDTNTFSWPISVYNGAGLSGNNYEGLAFDSNGTLIRPTCGSEGTTGTDIVNATWTHLALVRSSATVLEAFKNGVSDATENHATVAGRAAATELSIGRLSGGGRGDGRYCAIKIWTAALTGAELLNEMRMIRPIRTANLYLWSPGFPGATERLRDYSGNGRTWTEGGTLTDEDPPPIPWGANSWVVLASGVAVDARSGAAAGRTGAQGVAAGSSAQTSAPTARTGARGADAGASARTAASVGRVGARSLDAGTPARTSAPVGRIGAQSQCAGVKAEVAGTVGRAGARAQNTAASSIPQASTGAAVGSAGARAQSVGVKSFSAGSAGLAGVRGLAPGLKTSVAAAQGRAGCTAVTPGLAARLGASVARAGARSLTAGTQGTPVVPRCPVTVGLRPYTVHARTRDFNHDVPRRPLVLTVRNC